MNSPDQSRLFWVLSIRRFLEVAWTGNGAMRYLTVLAVPLLVAITTPGWWWLGCLVGACVSIALDIYSRLHFTRLANRLEELTQTELRGLMSRHVGVLSALITCYAAPYAALALAPAPGPVIGLLFCTASAIIITSVHVMTRTMIFFTIPAVAVGIVANAAALHSGWQSYALALLGAFVVVNALVTARAGARSFGDLIAARLSAEQNADVFERRVEERTAELVEVSRAAEAASKAKSAFLANMSHELRTPLNAIIGYSEIIEEDLSSGDIKACPQDIARVRNAALHLLGLIADVLDISKIEAEKLALAPQDVDVAALAREVVETVAPLAGGNNSVCDVIVEPCAATMHADPMRVKQCLMNLLSNAAKFTRNGRVVLHVRRVDFDGVDALAFTVRDTGIGISAENLERLFQPFVQADASITRAYGGTGLGLAITRRFARLMGGDVLAESELGRGSKFTLVVPRQPAPTAHSEARATAA
jgi:signal transduction histidine kinase